MNDYPEGNGSRWEEAKRVSGLIAGFLSNSLTESQHRELNLWINESDRNQVLFEELTDKKNISASLKWMEGLDKEKALAVAKDRIATYGERKKIAFSPKILVTWIAAASVIIVGIVLWSQRTETKEGKLLVEGVDTLRTDHGPGMEGAVLMLADGTEKILGDGISELPDQGGANLTHDSAGRLKYSGDGILSETVVYNKLITPRGKQYRVALSDGTVVWLNAASSIYYPAAFVGGERTVEITGEAYFDVAHDAEHPFIVKVKGHNIRVLGTSFNVNAYEQSSEVLTTLLNGSVLITDSTKNFPQTLTPGQSASTNLGSNTITRIDTDLAVAWKNGWFIFRDTKIEDIMAQISRWYDVDIVYRASPKQHFNGTIGRNVPVSELLHLLEGTGDVHFEVKGKEIIVKP
ncbi:MAG: DUF4974 domain-containing protein [Gemmatimonadaceae bacterium]|nr:DUF4974 domain-containing protein [Chitinophagaceae bacterium]